jgi:predicted glycosyltransferase involved in capsule biosynthesis
MSKLDVLYPFHFNNKLNEAIGRLKSSIDSIKDQNVNICISNTSKKSIKDYFIEYPNIKFFEEEVDIFPYCKPKTINKGVKNLVSSDYFLISDIDILYPANYVEVMEKLIDENKETVIRVIPFNYCVPFGAPLTYDECTKKGKIDKSSDNLRSNGYAVGIGLIYLPSFKLINGYNEEFKGYGQEDDEFNMRIGYINKIIEIPANILYTYHIYHEYEFPRCDTYEKNREINNNSRNRIKKEIGNEFFNIDKHFSSLIKNEVQYTDIERNKLNIN